MAIFIISLRPVFSQKLFQIGEVDASYKEFAIAGDYSLYPIAFPDDVDFQIGISNEKEKFPYIHPGPADYWAGSKPHTFRIKFNLDHLPIPSVRLLLYLVNTHYSGPPSLVFTLNGKEIASRQLPPGAGDVSLSDPTKGQRCVIAVFPSSEDFRIGENEIAIENKRGSWLLYDAIILEEGLNLGKPQISLIKVKDVPFFVREGEQIKQILRIWLENLGAEGKGELLLIGKAKKKEVPLNLVYGENILEIPLDEEFVDAEEIRIKVGEVNVVTKINKHKKWLLFLAPSVHTDIGYTDIQTNVVKRHNDNLKIILEEAKRNPSFKWNLEVAWQVENFLADEPEKAKELIELLREGRLSMQALYANMLTGLCSPESLARVCLLAKQLSTIYKFPLDSALLTDVPSAIFPLPSILSAFGIKYCAEGINGRSPYPPYPFYWEGPDGKRVLFCPSPGYGWARNIGLMESIEVLSSKLSSHLEGLENGGYPYDAYLLYGAFYDNELVDPNFMQLVEEWNKRYAYPRIIVATNSEFFRYLEENYKDKIPTYKLDAGGYWEDGAVSTAKELAMNRIAKNWATEAETLFSLSSILNPIFKYPSQELKELWRNILLFDEHTWGAWCSISDPYAETTLKQWASKASFAHKAYQEAENLREKAFQSLSSLVSVDKESILVFNPLSFPRSDIVRVKIPYDDFVILDDGREIAWQRDGEEVLFYAMDVPPLGYKTFTIEKGRHSIFHPRFKITEGKVESSFFTVKYSDKGILSIRDKVANKELLQDGKILGDYLYLAGPHYHYFSDRRGEPISYRLEDGKAWVENVGPIFSDICFSASAYKTPSYKVRLRIYNDLARCDITIDLEKEETLEKESIFTCFPFAIKDPRVRLEYPTCVLEPAKEQFPQACRNWFTIHQWAGLDDGRHSIVWCSLDAPLLTLGEPIFKDWLAELKPQNGTIFSYIMHNHWSTNYKASQGGKFSFRYAIFSAKGGITNDEASQLAWGFAHPLLARVVSPRKSLLPSGPYSFISSKGALITTIKKRDYGDGWILRLWRAERLTGKAELTINLPIKKVFYSTLSEEKGKELAFDKIFILSLPPSSLETLLLTEK